MYESLQLHCLDHQIHLKKQSKVINFGGVHNAKIVDLNMQLPVQNLPVLLHLYQHIIMRSIVLEHCWPAKLCQHKHMAISDHTSV